MNRNDWYTLSHDYRSAKRDDHAACWSDPYSDPRTRDLVGYWEPPAVRKLLEKWPEQRTMRQVRISGLISRLRGDSYGIGEILVRMTEGRV